MLKLAANLEFMFGDRDFVDRVDAVPELGMAAFEFGEWRNRGMPQIIERMKRHQLVMSNLGVDPRVDLLDGDGRELFVQAVRDSAEMAHQVGCTRLGVVVEHVNVVPGRPWHESQLDLRQRDTRMRKRQYVVDALKAAAPIAEAEGVTLLVECLNTLVDHADYFIAAWHDGVSIVREVGSPAVRLTFDVYHHQINEGNIIATITRDMDVIGHFHVGDVPGRHEPGTGEINYFNVLTAAVRAGYCGYLGLECVPSKSDLAAAFSPIRQIVEQINDQSAAAAPSPEPSS